MMSFLPNYQSYPCITINPFFPSRSRFYFVGSRAGCRGRTESNQFFNFVEFSEKEFPVPNMINLYEGVSFSLYIVVCLSVSICLTFYLSLSAYLCLSLSPSLSLRGSIFLFVYRCLSICLPLSNFLSVSLFVSTREYLSLCLSLSVYLSLSV